MNVTNYMNFADNTKCQIGETTLAPPRGILLLEYQVVFEGAVQLPHHGEVDIPMGGHLAGLPVVAAEAGNGKCLVSEVTVVLRFKTWGTCGPKRCTDLRTHSMKFQTCPIPSDLKVTICVMHQKVVQWLCNQGFHPQLKNDPGVPSQNPGVLS